MAVVPGNLDRILADARANQPSTLNPFDGNDRVLGPHPEWVRAAWIGVRKVARFAVGLVSASPAETSFSSKIDTQMLSGLLSDPSFAEIYHDRLEVLRANDDQARNACLAQLREHDEAFRESEAHFASRLTQLDARLAGTSGNERDHLIGQRLGLTAQAEMMRAHALTQFGFPMPNAAHEAMVLDATQYALTWREASAEQLEWRPPTSDF